jgi:hypothetical protein
MQTRPADIASMALAGWLLGTGALALAAEAAKTGSPVAMVAGQPIYEARKEGLIPEKLFERDADSHVTEPTDAEVEAYYVGQKDRLKRPLAEVKSQLLARSKQARIQQAREE